MKDQIKKFFRNKLNVTCFVIECVALLFLLIGACGVPVFIVLFLIMQGVAIIMWGVRTIRQNDQIAFNKQYYEELPFSKEDRVAMEKMDDRTMKNNKANGWIYIILGLVLILSCLAFI